jgi:hypothetical protein
MKKPIIFAIGLLSLVGCIGENAPIDNSAEVGDAELTGNRGRVLSSIQVPGYTYIEVRNNGRSLWLAGNPVEVAKGDVISWGQSALMQNFKSKALDKTFEEIIFVSAIYHGADQAPPVATLLPRQNSGIVRSTEDASGYSYIELETDAGKIVWLAAPLTEVEPGDRIEWKNASRMENFNSPSLGKTFPEILFVGGVAFSK